MAVISLDCPNCGAKLTPDDSKRSARCEYCGAQFQLPRVTAEKPKTRARGSGSRRASGSQRLAWITSVMVSLLGVGVAAYMALGDVAAVRTLSALGSGANSSGGIRGLLPALSVDFMWDQVGGPPQIVTLDGQEHVIGRLRKRGGEDTLHVGVFAAATGAERYRVGPFGTYGEAYQATHFAAIGERLLVTDVRGKLRVFALASGEPVTDIPLTDRASQLCLVEETGEAPQLYLAQVDKREFLVDAAAPALKEGKRPKACTDRRFNGGRDGDPRATDKERLRKAPKVDGVEVLGVHLEGDDAVARGIKAPGTAYPMAFGFDPKTREVRWKQPVAVVDQASVRERDNAQDALVAGRYFATYGEGTEYWHLAAFDARSGARLWDQKLRSIFAVDWLYGLAATAEHVYLVRMSSVEIYDAATGALKTTIGAETYDG